ncbi:hypothetical protein RJ639_046449 [Escallonia herrerae]|uniref:Homeobox-leucine zipper protein n=1 Tax=Escallonia herrerae TaxID=1293975 RepID=A0AA89B0P8_9ASTE|nr:hypothetical protein RJ639_046449 [Escallonia herrerae]
MEVDRVYDGSNVPLLLQAERLPCSSQLLESLWVPNSSPSFHGSTSMVNFENSPGENATGRSFFTPLGKEENDHEDYDQCFHQPEKKRRLTVDQVQFLERSFDVDNKLEPERKVELAKKLGLQPRQVAIWFQNRRARYKTKQLEKDYDSLKASYDKLKTEFDSLFKVNAKMKNEVQVLTEKVLLIEKEKAKSEPCDHINTLKLDAQPQNPASSNICHDEANAPRVVCKQEDANSAKSDVFDSDSPHCTEGNHSSFLEPADSSQAFEPESDFSQDEEDNLSRSFLPLPCFPKLEDGCYDDPTANSCDLGYSKEDQASWFWPY